MTKICSKCLKDLPLIDFPPYKGKLNGLNKCRPCKQEYDRHYHANRSIDNKQRKQDLQYARVRKLKQELWDYKASHPCIDCGEPDPIVLEFDHMDGTNKEDNISAMVNGGCSPARIIAEIEKCDVRCANCHRRRTHKQFGWFNGSEEES